MERRNYTQPVNNAQTHTLYPSQRVSARDKNGKANGEVVEPYKQAAPAGSNANQKCNQQFVIEK